MPCCRRCAAHAAVGAVAIAIAPAATGAAIIAVPAAVGAAVAARLLPVLLVQLLQSQLRNGYRHYHMWYRLFVPAPHVNKVPESSGTNSGLLISKRLLYNLSQQLNLLSGQYIGHSLTSQVDYKQTPLIRPCLS